MKILNCILLTLMCSCILLHEANAQKQGIFSRPYQPSFTKGTIKDFLDDINRNGHVTIEYASNSFEAGKLITIPGNSSTLGSILQQVLKDQKVSVIEKNNKIILVPSDIPLPDDAFVSSYSVYGIIKENSSEEPMEGATIWDPEHQRGALSNAQGYFTLLLPEGKHTLLITYAGYTSRQIDVDLQSNKRADIQLEPKSNIEAVTVTSSSNNKLDKNGAEKVSIDDNTYGMVLGESDVLRSLYVLPGITSTPEVTNGILVRGGSPDQNVFLLDGNPIFNPTHLLGTLSIINRTSLKTMNLYKSNFPARFGGGLSSVIDVSTKDGNMQRWQGEANAGLLAGSFTIEGPVVKDRTAIMLSVRQSWVNPFLQLVQSGLGINFYDVNFKCTQLIGRKDKLMLNVYAGHDKLNLRQDNTNNKQQWGNKAASLAWSRLLGPKTFINSSVSYSYYNNIAGFNYSLYDSTGYNIQSRVYNTFSSIQQYNARTQLEFSASNAIKFNIGGKAAYTSIKPFDTNVAADFAESHQDFNTIPPLSFREFVLFYENEIKIDNKFFFRPGLHVSHYQYNAFHYTSLQPRFYAVYKLNTAHQLDFSFNHMTQYQHLVTNPYLGINNDAWVPSTSLLSPEESNIVNVGYTYQDRKKLILSVEAYYKQLQNVTNYIDGKNLFLNNADWEQNLQSGKGWTYGLEVTGDKKTDKWQVHFGYTLSWNWRKFKGINDGQKFPFKYDRRHELNIAGTYKRNAHWDFSALWTFATGAVYTLPDRVYPDFDDVQQTADPLAPQEYRLIYHSSAANQYRTLPYHRLDVSTGYHHKLGPKLRALFTMGVYNIYGSPSQYVYDLEGTLGKRSLVVTTKYEFFTITPYVAYTVSF